MVKANQEQAESWSGTVNHSPREHKKIRQTSQFREQRDEVEEQSEKLATRKHWETQRVAGKAEHEELYHLVESMWKQGGIYTKERTGRRSSTLERRR